MSKPWNMTQPERQLVEMVVGKAILDKWRGHATRLADIYGVCGGADPDTLKILKLYDQEFATYERPEISAAAAGPGKSFSEAYKDWDMSSEELCLVERAIGQSTLLTIEGKPKNPDECYKSLGGSQPDAIKAMSDSARVGGQEGSARFGAQEDKMYAMRTV
jgi:hypothetical protein